ncbi:MAG: hypothetical protein K8R48_04700, partial [Alphaproteobacteria bacterium]|nr:hypothetical protein [Alphaproteobacteria bacterium]
MKKLVQRVESLFSFRRLLAGKLPAAIFLVAFVFGYNAATSVIQPSGAQATPVVATPTAVLFPVGAPGCPGSTPVIPSWLCDSSGTANKIKKYLIDGLEDALKDSADELEKELHDLNKDMIKAMLKRLNVTEKDIISWWKTMWFENLSGSFKDQANQLNVSTANQSQVTQTVIDSQNVEETKQELQKSTLEAKQTASPSEKGCAPATVVGGIGKVVSISKGWRGAVEKKSLRRGLNKKGSKGATSATESEAVRYEDYKTLFCDPDGNSGRNDCPASTPADEKYVNADTQPSTFIYGQTTIPVDPDHDPQWK